MQPASFDFALMRGDDVRVVFLFRDAAGDPVNLTGSVMALTVTRPYRAEPLDISDLVIDAIDGRVEWRATAADTLLIPTGRLARYALSRTDPADGHRTYLVGTVTGSDGPSNGDVGATLAVLDDAIEITLAVGGLHGIGIPAGGAEGQVLVKTTDNDFDTAWIDPAGGGGPGDPIAIADVTGLPEALADKATDAELADEVGARQAGDAALDGRLDTAETKLVDIAAGATANASDAQLRDRATHTGTQAIGTVGGLQAALDAKVASAEKAAANGVATLGADGKIPTSQLPALATVDTFVINSQAALLALDAQRGDQAVRTDLNKTFSLAAEPATTLANWIEHLTPTDMVLSVAGRTGAVSLTKADVGLGNVDNTADAAKPVSTAQQTALDGKQAASAVLTFLATATAGTTAAVKTLLALVKGDVGLGNVDNTSDVGKPVSTAQAAAILDSKPIEPIIVALGDESAAITTGNAKVTMRMPYAFTLSAVRASLTTASSAGLPTVDINEGGVSILSTKLTIDATELTSTTAATAAVISDANLADDAEITFDIDVAGTGAKGLKVVLIGRRA